LPDIAAPTWFAVFLPRGAPEPIVRKLNQAASATADTPSVQKRLIVLVVLKVTEELIVAVGLRPSRVAAWSFALHSIRLWLSPDG
jgi:hypothetical protein